MPLILLVMFLAMYNKNLRASRGYSENLSRNYQLTENFKTLSAILPMLIANTIFQLCWTFIRLLVVDKEGNSFYIVKYIYRMTLNILFIIIFQYFQHLKKNKTEPFHMKIIQLMIIPFRLSSNKERPSNTRIQDEKVEEVELRGMLEEIREEEEK
uniref:G_PROTEIN_RECEP_F1_2 domain-containing protein n=1 Tax=Parastrongyloides trichosuri TaxID=131310 RepID=A0A0N4Z142_PARTI